MMWLLLVLSVSIFLLPLNLIFNLFLSLPPWGAGVGMGMGRQQSDGLLELTSEDCDFNSTSCPTAKADLGLSE